MNEIEKLQMNNNKLEMDELLEPINVDNEIDDKKRQFKYCIAMLDYNDNSIIKTYELTEDMLYELRLVVKIRMECCFDDNNGIINPTKLEQLDINDKNQGEYIILEELDTLIEKIISYKEIIK